MRNKTLYETWISLKSRIRGLLLRQDVRQKRALGERMALGSSEPEVVEMNGNGHVLSSNYEDDSEIINEIFGFLPPGSDTSSLPEKAPERFAVSCIRERRLAYNG